MKHQNSKFNEIKKKLKSKDAYDPYKYAAIYARRSIQTENYSLDSQISDCMEYLNKTNLILYDIYKDKISGKRPFQEREEFTKLLNHLYAGMFKTVVIARMDRLSRDIDDFIRIKEIFKANDVNVIYVKEPGINSSQNGYMSSFLENMIIAISTFEPDNINERISTGKANARKMGRYPLRKNPAFGFYRSKENYCEYSIVTEEAEAIKMFFKGYVNKVGTIDEKGKIITIRGIIDNINNTIKLKTKFKSSNYNDKINNPIYAKHMFINPDIPFSDMIIWDDKIKQYIVSDDNLIECTNIHGPIISLDLWKKAFLKYHIPKLNKPKITSAYLFKDMLFCGKCSKKIILIKDTYSCSKKCTQIEKSKLLHILLHRIIEDVDNELLKKELLKEISTIEKEKINSYKKKLYEIENILRKKLHSYINSPNNSLLKDNYIKTLQEYENLKSTNESTISYYGELKRKIEDIDSLKFKLAEIASKDEEFINNNLNTIQNLLSNYINKVVLNIIQNESKTSIKFYYTQE